MGKEKERINGIESEGKEDQSFFLLASYLGTAVVSVRTHARTLTQHTHTTHTTRVQTNLQLHSDLKTASFLEITEILKFRRRRAHHDPIVTSRERGTVYNWVLHSTHPGTAPALRSPGIERWRADSPLRVLPLSHRLVRQ